MIPKCRKCGCTFYYHSPNDAPACACKPERPKRLDPLTVIGDTPAQKWLVANGGKIHKAWLEGARE